MIGLDETQVDTLADGWGFTPADVFTATQIADAFGMELPDFVATFDHIVRDVRAHIENGGAVREDFSASQIMQCYARAAQGLPLDA
jgi:hypothetical protein